MAPSQRNLYAVLLLVIMAATESSLSAGEGCNRHLSGSYKGPCFYFNDGECNTACVTESSDNESGSCVVYECWCYTRCHSKTVAPASTPIWP
ncbi:hypothetical protein BS78_K260500 [Paspalum vaginatum]|uniref:Knottin scorpion toxin-like domain-containing protein n=1 Tax=Paspalum vaginatum TaxID=158149 RepID=A0A9W8CGN9_9POAL|nr:hypothetical protein BS78_K260500 [Paspalum vaginatum]